MKTVLEELSPNGNIEALVDEDDRVVYFYLRGAPDTEFGFRSCWVRNLKAAPSALDVEGMRRGVPPMLPRNECSHPDGSSRLNPRELRIVWFEEGDAAALLEGESVLAVIPSWSGAGGFDGYARDCVGEGPLCWPLLADNAILRRIRLAEEWWAAWDSEITPWLDVQESQVNAYEGALGPHEKYYAIDGKQWPPKALLRVPVSGGVALVTVGVCLRPQPAIERAMQDPTQGRRIELAMGVSSELSGQYNDVARYVSAQSNLPWSSCAWLGHGHTIPCDALGGTGLSSVLLHRSPLGAPAVNHVPFRGDPVNLLWAVGITEEERAFAIENGSEALMQVLENKRIGWLAKKRQSVI